MTYSQFPELSGVSVDRDFTFEGKRTLRVSVHGDRGPVVEFFKECGYDKPFEFVHPETREKLLTVFRWWTTWDPVTGDPAEDFFLVVASRA